MKWIGGVQQALDLIEQNLAGEIDYAQLAQTACCSEYNFMRVFSVLSGYTLADYIRCRRLTVAGQELVSSDIRILDLALKYGYDSPEAFSRAFQKFHGILPAQARKPGATLRTLSPLHLTIHLEGGFSMNYRIEEKPAQRFLGFRRRFTGTPDERAQQEEDFFIHTRLQQYALMGLAGDTETQHTLILNAGADGYDFFIAVPFDERLERFYEATAAHNPDLAALFEIIEVPAATYAAFETGRSTCPTINLPELRRQAISEWLPSSGCLLSDGAEMEILHWYNGKNGTSRQNRYIELLLPITR